MCSILAYCSKEADAKDFSAMLSKTTSRGPDDSRIIETPGGYMGFNRLSIMGLTPEGMQPFTHNDHVCICNGELYGFRPLKTYLENLGDTFESDSDCEILLPLYERLGTSLFSLLDAEFALVIYDATKQSFIAARDPFGMYLVCKWIHENTDLRVILTGEISDELFGYKYTDFAPDADAFQKEAQKRIHEIHMYDVLRADRCISVNSLEAHVPFGDLAFVDYVMRIHPALKMNRYGIGKYLLRHAFEQDYLIPETILMREKAAFSDAVGHSLRDVLIEYAESIYTDDEFENRRHTYQHATPFTKESLLYREIFEKYYSGQSHMITDFWMPNREWEGCNVNDPSARVLSNYGQSGE